MGNMVLDDLMRNFIGKIVDRGEKKQCEKMKPCLAVDVYEYTVVMLLLKSIKELMGSGIQIQIDSENLLMKSHDYIYGISECETDKNRISYTTSVGTTNVQIAKEYVINYLSSAVMQINLATAEQDNYRRRNYNKGYAAMAMLTPCVFVTINMNLIYSYIKFMGMASGWTNVKNVTDMFIQNVSYIVDAAKDKAIVEYRKKYLTKYREVFTEDAKNVSVSKLTRVIGRKFTGIDILIGDSFDMQYMPHLSMIRRFVEKVLDLYGRISPNGNKILHEYITTLKWLEDSDSLYSQKADKWVSRISEIKTERQFLDIIKEYCNEYKLLLVEDAV